LLVTDFNAAFGAASWQYLLTTTHSSLACCNNLDIVLCTEAKSKHISCCADCPQSALALQVFQTMVGSGVELTITTFGTLLIAGADAHDYDLVQEVTMMT